MKKSIKFFLKPFLFLYIIFVLILNWNDISWVFNYEFFSSYFDNIFNSKTADASQDLPNNQLGLIKEDSLFIPKINLSAPIVFSQTNKISDIQASLARGVLLYPSSVLPGEEGETIILGHSAPESWPKVNYYHVFNKLNNLEVGDEISLYFKSKEYIYKVTKKFFVPEGADVKYTPATSSKNLLILISCWPANKGNQRIIIQAE